MDMNLIPALKAHTDLIASKEAEIAAAQQELRTVEQQLSSERAIVEQEIAMDKAAYPNDAARKAALTVRLSSHPDIKRLQAQVNHLTTEIAMLQVARDDASRQRQNIIAIMAHATSENYRLASLPQLSGFAEGRAR